MVNKFPGPNFLLIKKKK